MLPLIQMGSVHFLAVYDVEYAATANPHFVATYVLYIIYGTAEKLKRTGGLIMHTADSLGNFSESDSLGRPSSSPPPLCLSAEVHQPRVWFHPSQTQEHGFFCHDSHCPSLPQRHAFPGHC